MSWSNRTVGRVAARGAGRSPCRAVLTLTVLLTWMLVSFRKQSSFRKSQICFTVCFTWLLNSVLGCRVSMIQVSSSLAVTVVSPFLDGTCLTSILPAVVAPSALS